LTKLFQLAVLIASRINELRSRNSFPASGGPVVDHLSLDGV
jgi:hypothetical protein